MRSDYPQLVEAIYDASLTPSNWPATLNALSDALGGTSSWISNISKRTGKGTGLGSRLDPAYGSQYEQYFYAVNPFAHPRNPDEYLENWRPCIRTEEFWRPVTGWSRCEYYNEFMIPQEVGHVLIAGLSRSGDYTSAININRPASRGGFELDDLNFAAALHRHLMRAHQITRALLVAHDTEINLVALLQKLPQPVFILDADMRLRGSNGAADVLLSAGRELQLVGGQLGARDPATAGLLKKSVARAASRSVQVRAASSVIVPAQDGLAPLSLSITPLGEAHASFFMEQSCALVWATDLTARPITSERHLTQLFGLTATESRVAKGIQSGARLQKIADDLQMTRNTARNHLSSIFSKTGTSRQAELAQLLLLAPPE